MVLLKDQFINALAEPQLQIYVKQSHPVDLEVLAQALEFVSCEDL